MGTKKEVFLVVLVVLGIIASVAGFKYYEGYYEGQHSGERIAVIIQDNRIIERINLDKVEKPRNILISGDYHNLIRVEKGRIRFEKSDCPNQSCVHTGWLEKYGDIAVCMPNRVIVEITTD